MALNDLVFKISNVIIYDPVDLSSTVTVEIKNEGEEELTGLGIYITPSLNHGDVDAPAEFSPETDYQDLIEWGTNNDLAISSDGGLFVSGTDSGGAFGPTLITRSVGCLYSNKIEIEDLASGASTEIELEFETPTGAAARRFYIDLRVE